MDKLEKRLEVLFELEKYDEVLKLAFEHLHNNDANELLLSTYIITAHMNLNRYSDALEFCNDAIGKYPDHAYLFLLRAKIYFQEDDSKQATKDVKESLRLDSNDANAYSLQARIYLDNKKFVEAKESINRALEIDSSNLDAHIINAMILYMIDGESVAKEIIDEVLQKDPNNVKALDVKQNFFTTKLKDKKSILQNLLFLNPFNKEHQASLNFIRNYYKYIPICMLTIISLSFLLHVERGTFGFLQNWLVVPFLVVALIGSNDYRFNVPFIAMMFGINMHFTSLSGIEISGIFVIVFLAVIKQFFFMAIFPLTVIWKNRLLKRFERE